MGRPAAVHQCPENNPSLLLVVMVFGVRQTHIFPATKHTQPTRPADCLFPHVSALSEAVVMVLGVRQPYFYPATKHTQPT